MSDQARGGWLSPFLQRRRIVAALPHIRGDILDYGCGNGELYGHLDSVTRVGYLGYDVDHKVVALASNRWPKAKFVSDLGLVNGRNFDTIVSLAVIEHVPCVKSYLEVLSGLLRPDGILVLSSPNGAFDPIHRWGARVGLFSVDASEEHNEYVSSASLEAYCADLDLEMYAARTFLLGANQLFVLKRSPGRSA